MSGFGTGEDHVMPTYCYTAFIQDSLQYRSPSVFPICQPLGRGLPDVPRDQ